MLLKRLELQNFQSYYEKQTLEFSNGLNLIIGKGGKGKSKLFNAFNWVLFDRIYITDVGWCKTDDLYSTSKGLMRRDQFINYRAMYMAKIGEMVTASVTLVLEDDKGVEYTIERSTDAKRISEGDWKNGTSWTVHQSNLVVTYETNAGMVTKIGLLAEQIIERLFPSDIRNYIWFQGESLESLIDFRDAKTLENAVKHISYYPYYEKLSQIITLSTQKIERMEGKSKKEANQHNEKVSQALAEQQKYKDQILKVQEEIEKQKDLIATLEISLAEDEAKLGKMADFSSLVNDYNTCERNINDLNNQISNKDAYQREKLPTLWMLRGIEPMLDECKDIIEHFNSIELSEPKKKFLDNPSKSMLENILHSGQCFVCGNKVEEGNDAYNWVVQRLKDQEEYFKELEEYKNSITFNHNFSLFLGKIMDYPSTLKIALSSIDKQFTSSEDDIDRLRAKRSKLFSKKMDMDKEIERIKAEYGIDPRSQAGSSMHLSSNIKATRSTIDKQKERLRILKGQKETYKTEFNKATETLTKLGNDTKIIDVPETEWLAISSYLSSVCSRVTESARKTLLRDIEKRANKFYAKFTEHDTGYKGKVSILDDYTIEFDSGLNTSHEDRKKMSVINALLSLNQEAVDIYYPFISDAPTSNFDTDTTYKYLLGIKDIFDQSIIITKDVDYESDQYNELYRQDNVSHIYMLESNIYGGAIDPKKEEVSSIIKTLK